MNGAQKVIKALAMALAAIIIISMVSAFLGVGMVLSRVFAPGGSEMSEWAEVVISEDEEFVRLEIELKVTSLKIESGEKFQVVADDEVIEVRREGDVMKIVEKDLDFFGRWHEIGDEVKVTLPKGVSLGKMEIEMGAGTMLARDLVTEELELDLGAGRVEIEGVTATRRAKINGGAGLLVIRKAKLRGLDFDMGVGKAELETSLTGDAEINAGVGKLELTLIGEENDYRVEFDQGVGSLHQEGISLNNPEGKNLVKIDGGVGAIDLRLVAE